MDSPPAPAPSPKYPPEFPDLYGKRRGMARIQMLEREIGFLEEELKSVERSQLASKSCKEVADFVIANPDPFLPTISKKKNKSGRFRKWFCGISCFNLSSICGCCSSHCSCRLKCPSCGTCSLCSCSLCDCISCNCNSLCLTCPKPDLLCCCFGPRSNCCQRRSCGLCSQKCCSCGFPSCPDCSCCLCKCSCPQCPKVCPSSCCPTCCNPCHLCC